MGARDGLGEKDVSVQDQTSTPVDFFFTQIKGAPTTVAVATVIDDLTVELASAAGCTIGDYFGMFNADDRNDNRFYHGEILNIATNVITLDTPIDFAFKVGNTAACFTRELNVNGNVTPQTFAVQVGEHADQSIDINRLIVHMETDSTVSLAKFGDLTKLVKGVVLRRVDGTTNNIWNIKTNGEMKNLCFDWSPTLATNPADNVDGASFRYSFNGQDKHGVAVRLFPGDELQLIIQDDLTGLTQFRVIAEGHYVVD
jgi:hypothetical protein